MKLNKMETVQLEIITPTHIGTGTKMDRFDQAIDINYNKCEIDIHGYKHKIFIENYKSDKEINITKPKLSSYVRGNDKFYVAKCNDKNGNERNILFDNEKLLKQLRYSRPIGKLTKLDLTNIEYWNVALKNPVATLPYNNSNFYIPASSLKGAIKYALSKFDSNYADKNDNSPTHLPLNRWIGDCQIENRKALKIDIVHKMQYPVDDSQKSIKIQTNPTNQKQFIKSGSKLELSINKIVLEDLMTHKQEVNKQLVQRLQKLDSKYSQLITEMIRNKDKLNYRTNKMQIEAIEEELKIIGLDGQKMSYSKSHLSQNIENLIKEINDSNDVYLVIGANKGKQLIFDQKLEQFGLNFIDSMPIGIIKVSGGNNVRI